MNPHTIRRLFPNASKSIIAANAQDYGKPHAEDTLPLAAVERNSSHAPLETKEVQRRTDGRFLVRVESVRKRLADEDGLCEKYVLDCCRYAGLIPDDSPELCKVETSQRKAAKGEEEHTQITITYP
jgi:hypothetical protein